MQRRAGKRRALSAIGLMVGASVALFTASVSPASGDEPDPQLQVLGVLRLHLAGSGGTVTFTPTGAPAPTATQAISATGKCAASSNGPLIVLSSTGGTQGLGLVNNGLGVRQKNTCGTAEGRVGGSERLTLALGTAFGDGTLIADAELDIEGKFNASLDVSFDGGSVVNRTLVNASDNGPDSGVGDNTRVLLSSGQPGVAPFRTMTLSAPIGEVSLEGGGDGSYAQFAAAGKIGPVGAQLATADTLLRVVHRFADDLSCGETRPGTVIGGSATSAEVTRLDNDGGGECEDVGVTIEILDEGVLLDKGTTGLATGAPQAVNALVDIVWTAQPAELPIPAREINFEPDDPNGWETVQWCDAWDPVTQTAVHPPDARFPGGVLPWCLVDDDVELQDDGTVVQIQRYHGDGDPMWR
jgi:hypothetical protein